LLESIYEAARSEYKKEEMQFLKYHKKKRETVARINARKPSKAKRIPMPTLPTFKSKSYEFITQEDNFGKFLATRNFFPKHVA